MSVGGTARYRTATHVPPLVVRAAVLGYELGFENSCIPEQGRLLRVLAAGTRGRSHRRDGHRLRRRPRVVGERRGRDDADRLGRTRRGSGDAHRGAVRRASERHGRVRRLVRDSRGRAVRPARARRRRCGQARRRDRSRGRARAGRDARDRRLHAVGRVAADGTTAAPTRRGCTGSSIRCCRPPRSGRQRRARRSSRHAAGDQG